MNTLTKTDAERLAAFLHGIRPDWYPAETVKALGEAAKRAGPPDAYAIAVAAVRCAANPANGSPAHIPRHGAHWTPWPGDAVATPTPERIVTCEHCGGYIADTNRDQHLNRRCVADHQAGVYASGAAAAKAALADARAGKETA